MQFEITKINKSDKTEILSMMRDFYSSDAVYTNGSDEIFECDFNHCTCENPYLEGFIFRKNTDVLGYAMIAKSFSTEFGKQIIWFEDLYIKPEFRGNKIIPQFIEYIKNIYSDSIFKLEVEKENEHAIYVYKKSGFKILPYTEMIITK